MSMRYLVLLICLCTGYAAPAQVFAGIKLGAGTSELNDKELKIFDPGGLERFGMAVRESGYSVHGGLVLQARIKSIFLIQPEVHLQSNSIEYRVQDFANPSGPVQLLSEKYQYVNLPLLVGLKVGPLRLQAGPQGHVFLSSRSDLDVLEGYKEDFRQISFSWLAGAGIDIWKTLMLDFRYEGSLSRFGEHITFFGRPYAFDQRPSRLLASVGLLFGKKDTKG